MADAVRGNPNLTLATVLLQLGGWLDEELAGESVLEGGEAGGPTPSCA